MKINLSILLIILITTLCCFNVSAQKSPGYTVSGQIKGAANTKVYLMDFSVYRDMAFRDSVTTDASGHFSFHGSATEPCHAYFEVKDIGALQFILENAKINFVGDAADISSIQVTGSKENAVYTEAQRLIDDDAFNKLYKQSDKAIANAKTNKDTVALKAALAEKQSVMDKDQLRIKTFINDHPNTYAPINMIDIFISRFHNFRLADSLLKNAETSVNGNNSEVKYLRQRLTQLERVAIGNAAPDFIQNDTLGNPVKLSSLKGKYVLIDFWASWCGPCRLENPNVAVAYSKFNNHNFTVLSVSLDSHKPDWINAIHKDNLVWQQVSDLKGYQNVVAKQYAVDGIPKNFLIDPKGKIIATDLMGPDLQAELAQLLQ